MQPRQNGKNILKILKLAALAVVAAISLLALSCGEKQFVFSCSLIDGGVYETQTITFSANAYYGGEACELLVTLNEKPQSENNGNYTVLLSGGENVITVRAKSGDKSQEKTYKITYEKKDFEIRTDISEQKIINGKIEFSALAYCNGAPCEIMVLHGDKPLEKTNETYLCELDFGDNEFVFAAASGNSAFTEKHNVYRGKFELNTSLKQNEQTDKNAFSFRAQAGYDGELCELNVSVNGEILTPSGNKYSYVFEKSGEYEFLLKALKQNVNAEYSWTYTVAYSDEPPYFDLITFENGKKCKGDRYTFDVAAKNGLGKKLSDSDVSILIDFDGDDGKENFTIPENGELSLVWSDAVKTSYRLNFGAGRYKNALGKKTIVRVAAAYGDKQVYKDFEIYYVGPDADGKTGKITFSIEAFTIDSGYILQPMFADIYQGDNFAKYLCDIITSNGWTYTHTGEIKSGFYLAQIGGLELSGNKINDKLASLMTADGDKIFNKTISPRENGKYALGEFDFASGSGWMYSVNGSFPNYGFSDYYPQDGDVVRVQFTLCLGKDLGGSDAVGFGSKNYIENPCDYAEIHEILADVKRNDYYGKTHDLYDEAIIAVAVWNADEKTLKTYAEKIKSYYFA